MPTVQWDMYEAERIGFDKYDILSQRGIGHIKQAIKLVEENQQRKVDIHQVKKFMSDPVVNAQLRSGNTIGCFYIESPAMRQLIKKLNCDNYLVLVAASSIIRPGVASSGMMGEYIRFHHDPSKVKYLHPVMEDQLRETYGVMVYQEDVIKVCIHFAGMDGTDADILRRGMSGKYRSKTEFDRLVERFFQEAKKLGRPDDLTAEIWRQVSSFAGYSFSKAHSASFAVESYQSLYLKTYYPREFMVAVLNNYGGFYNRALSELNNKNINSFTLPRDKIEYYYRIARIYDAMDKDDEAIPWYLKAIAIGKTSTYHYAATSAIRMGIIYEQRKDYAKARNAYQMISDFSTKQFKNSLEQKAKDGLNRVKGK
jgi:DNA polymerase-3 subunit alpha